jgi:D-arabinose 1-dehydrogenase-like Zn-dependent alcohol dehydrogenase
MKIKRNGSQPSSKGPADWFTGTVRIDSPFKGSEPARVTGAIVTFKTGARTAWHTHPLGQTLIVTGGCGAPEKPLAVAAFGLIAGRRSLSGSAIGGIAETQEMFDFCGKHNLTSDVEVIPIQKVNEAYERLLKSDVKYRFSIDLASLKSE